MSTKKNHMKPRMIIGIVSKWNRSISTMAESGMRLKLTTDSPHPQNNYPIEFDSHLVSLCLVSLVGWLKLTPSMNNIGIIRPDQTKMICTLEIRHKMIDFHLSHFFSHYNQSCFGGDCGLIPFIQCPPLEWKFSNEFENSKTAMIKISCNRMHLNKAVFFSLAHYHLFLLNL